MFVEVLRSVTERVPRLVELADADVDARAEAVMEGDAESELEPDLEEARDALSAGLADTDTEPLLRWEKEPLEDRVAVTDCRAVTVPVAAPVGLAEAEPEPDRDLRPVAVAEGQLVGVGEAEAVRLEVARAEAEKAGVDARLEVGTGVVVAAGVAPADLEAVCVPALSATARTWGTPVEVTNSFPEALS